MTQPSDAVPFIMAAVAILTLSGGAAAAWFAVKFGLKSTTDKLGAVEGDVSALKREFGAYREHVALTYVPSERIRESVGELKAEMRDVRSDMGRVLDALTRMLPRP